MSERGWIGVDLDGTLAHHGDWKGINYVGRPIPKMLERVKRWIREGKKVKIFTARASDGETAKKYIRDWLEENGLPRDLEITDQKDYGMIELWDDRCVQLIPNTGRRIDREEG